MMTVLVVDDDPDICAVLETFLCLADFDVITASNGRDALQKLCVTVILPSVILLDLMMPVMDGIEFRRHQQADMRIRDIPVVCLSARHDAQQTAMRLGILECLGKPFELDAVLAAIFRHCGV